MSQMPTAVVSSLTELDEQKKAAAEAVASYLQTPRKKRKTYIVVAFGPNLDHELSRNIVAFVQKRYPKHAISICHNEEELQRNFGRKLGLVIAHDEFSDRSLLMKTIAELKKRKKNEGIPVLFLTRSPSELLASYNKYLRAYHEIDEFVHYHKMSFAQISSRIVTGIESQNRRRSRRFKIHLPIQFDHLRLGERCGGAIVDISVHGAMITAAEENFIFNEGDQVRLLIPRLKVVAPERGDYFHLSGVVRRVFISANTASLAFEHMNDTQYDNLLRLIVGVVRGKVPNQKNKNV